MLEEDKMKNRDNSHDTEQSLKFDKNGKFAKGTGVPAGFNKHPENRHNGSWHKEDTPRYWLETMMKMDSKELNDIIEGNHPVFRKKMAQCILTGEWKELKEMIQEVYGKMPEMQITMEADEDTKEETTKIIRGFLLP